jgi:hypothetical protein
MKHSVVFAALLIVALAGAAFAQSDTYGNSSTNSSNMSSSTTTSSTQNVSGTVVSSSDNSVVITTDDGSRMTFTRDTSSGNIPKNLKTGDRVTVQYDTPTPGTYHVTMLSMGNNTGTSGTYGNSSSSGTTGTSNYGSTSTTTSSTYDNTTAGTSRHNRAGMPRTASPLPLIGLAGIAALGAGLGIRALKS